MSHNLIAYYENGIPYTANGQRILKIIPSKINGREALERIKSDFMPSTPHIFPGIGYGSYAKPSQTLTEGARYAPGGGISARDMTKLWEANGKNGICPVCSRKQCPFIDNEIKRALGLLDRFGDSPNGEKKAIAQFGYHYQRPLLNIKNMFNSTAPVVMSHLSMLENKRFDSTKDNLNGLFADRCLLDTRIGSFKSLSSNAQTTLQIFAYGNESRDPKYDNFYHHMGSVEGSGRGSTFGKRDYNSSIKELYNNMIPTLKNIFVLDEMVKEFDKFDQLSTEIKNIGKSATDFIKNTLTLNPLSDNKDIVKNEYDFFTGRKTKFQRDIQQGQFFWGNMKAALAIGQYSRGSTNITTNAMRFSTQGDSMTNPHGVLQNTGSKEGSQVNAFRHVLWQSAITARFGKETASLAADAHERYDTLDLSVRQFPTSEAADETIDMLNNRTGRQIGGAHTNTSMKEQAKAVLNHFHKEGLYVAKENASGFAVVKEKITDEQFSYMNSQYDRGDNEGFSPEQLANGERKDSYY